MTCAQYGVREQGLEPGSGLRHTQVLVLAV